MNIFCQKLKNAPQERYRTYWGRAEPLKDLSMSTLREGETGKLTKTWWNEIRVHEPPGVVVLWEECSEYLVFYFLQLYWCITYLPWFTHFSCTVWCIIVCSVAQPSPPVSEYFHHLEESLVPLCSHLLCLPQPQPTTNLLSIATVLPFLKLGVSGITQYGRFCAWLLSLSMVFGALAHIVCYNHSFLFIAEVYSVAWTFRLFSVSGYYE